MSGTGKQMLLIANPCAGRKRASTELVDIVSTLQAAGHRVSVHVTSGRGDAREVAAREAERYEMVVVCGGDGTLNEVLNGLMTVENRPPIGYVPTGTTNDFATSLGLPKKPKQAVENLLRGTPHPHDVGWFGGAYFSYIASLGAFTRVSYTTPQKLKNTFGHMAYLLEGVKDIGALKPFHLQMEWTQGRCEGEYLFGSVSNSTSVAGLFKLNPQDVQLDDGKFEVLLVRNPHNPVELQRIVTGLVHQKYDERYVTFFHTDRLHIQTDPPLPWTLDGECGGEHREIWIENRPQAIQIVCERKKPGALAHMP